VTACLKCGHDPLATVTASWAFHVPRDLPSLNKRIHNGAHGWRYRRVRESWISDMKTMKLVAGVQTANINKRRVTLVRLYSGHQREMDAANIDTKACVDAMRYAGLIVDDSPRWLELHVKQERSKERGLSVLIERGLSVLIEELAS
jgi:hypothetical protein